MRKLERKVMLAIKNEDTWKLKLILSENVMSVNFCNKEQNTPLHYAIYTSANCDIVESLLQNGAYPNFRNIYNETPVLLSALYSTPEILEVLLSYGGDIFNRDSKRRTILHFAALGCQDEDDHDTTMLRHIVDHYNHVDIDSQDYEGNTALHLLPENTIGFTAARYLLKTGAFPNIKNKRGSIPSIMKNKIIVDKYF